MESPDGLSPAMWPRFPARLALVAVGSSRIGSDENPSPDSSGQYGRQRVRESLEADLLCPHVVEDIIVVEVGNLAPHGSSFGNGRLHRVDTEQGHAAHDEGIDGGCECVAPGESAGGHCASVTQAP